MRGFSLAALCAASVVAMAGAANAAIVTLTFNGTAFGNDRAGVFGPEGGTIDAPFTAVVQFDNTNARGFGGGTLVLAGTSTGVPSPITSATLTIGSGTLDFAALNGDVDIFDGRDLQGSNLISLVEVRLDGSGGQFNLGGFQINPPLVGDVMTLSFPPGREATGNAEFANADSFAFQLSSASSNQITAAIPEPTTWALLIAGFGGVGGMLRRRRTLASA
jgi:hypothetical protein